MSANGHLEKVVELLVPKNEAERCAQLLTRVYEMEVKAKIDDWATLKALIEKVHRDSLGSTQVMGKAFKKTVS